MVNLIQGKTDTIMLKAFVIILTFTLLSCTNSANSTNTETVDSKEIVKKETLLISDTFAISGLIFLHCILVKNPQALPIMTARIT